MRLLKRLVDIFFWLLIVCFGACFAVGASAVILEERIALPLRSALAYLTRIAPFSIFEVLLIGAPILLLALLAHGHLSAVVTVAKLTLVGYVITLGIPSRLPPRVSEPDEPTFSEYIRAAELVCDHLGTLSPIDGDMRRPAAEAAADYARRELCIEAAYTPVVKTSLAPAVLTDMGVLAYYAFPTAEVTVNGTAPDFMRTFSTAHELMHFLGVVREDEANLYAFISLADSGDDTLKFSAYLSAFVYLGAEIGAQNVDTYEQIYAQLPENARNSLKLRREFLADRDAKISDMSASLGDVTISLRDPRGAESYSYTSRLIVDHLLQ